MTRDELLGYLKSYGSNIAQGSAKTTDFIDIKNKIRQAYDAGNLDKEVMKELSDKATHSFKNMGKAQSLTNIPETIIGKGGTVGSIEGMKTKFPSLTNKLGNRGFAKVLPVLGLGATALGALGIAQKVQAGELGEAAADTADIATDYIPGISQIKAALGSPSVGEGSDKIDPNQQFDFSKFRANPAINQAKMESTVPVNVQPIDVTEETPERAKYTEFKNLMSRLKK